MGICHPKTLNGPLYSSAMEGHAVGFISLHRLSPSKRVNESVAFGTHDQQKRRINPQIFASLIADPGIETISPTMWGQ